jgi:pimeloyl-ACP methyl ester carboxylesterase
MAKAHPARSVKEEPRVRRGYFECRHGQLHVHNAIPPGGGFEEGTALLCLHQGGASGRTFTRFLSPMGRDRSVYAPDLPGCGESDPPASRPGIADYAAAIGDFLDTMRFRNIDVLGHRSGSLIAAELAVARPQQVRRVVMVGVPVLNEAEREAGKRAVRPAPTAGDDGRHLTAEWSVSAALNYAVGDRLVGISQPVLVLRPKDDLWEPTGRVRELLPRARYLDVPEHGQSVFDTAPDFVASAMQEFLAG